MFGVQVQLRHLPLWFLVLALPALPFIRESYPIFWSSQSIRPLTAFTAIIFIVLSLIWHWRDKVIHASPLVVGLIALFWVIHALSTALSEFPWQGSAHLFEMLLYAMSSLLLYHQLRAAPEFKRLLSISLMLMLFFIILRLLYAWISVFDPANYPWSTNPPLATNIRHIGYMATLLLPIGYTFLLVPQQRVGYWLTIIFLIASWGLVYWMGGRATFLAILAVTLIFCFFHRNTFVVIGLTSITGLLLSQIFIVTDGSLNLFRLFDFGDGHKDLNQLSSHRLTIYQKALHLWWHESPWLGLGSDAFRYLRPAILNDYFAQPHSVFIQVILSSGLAGILTLAALITLLVKAWATRTQTEYPGLIMASVAALLAGMIDGVFYHSLSFFTACLVITLSLPPSGTGIRRSFFTPTTVIATLISVVFFSVFSWQLMLSRVSTPSLQQLNFVSQYPIYINAQHWLIATPQHHNETILMMAEKMSDNPCTYKEHFTPEVASSFDWCKPVAKEKPLMITKP